MNEFRDDGQGPDQVRRAESFPVVGPTMRGTRGLPSFVYNLTIFG